MESTRRRNDGWILWCVLTLVLLGVYVGAYSYLVGRVFAFTTRAYPTYCEHEVADAFLQLLFQPVHSMDLMYRPDYWEGRDLFKRQL